MKKQKRKPMTEKQKNERSLKAAQVADQIMQAFKNPELLPKALSNIFIMREGSDKPCHSWSWMNQFILAMSLSGDARTFNDWKKLDRNVIKDRKAIYILRPIKIMREDKTTGEKIPILIGFAPTARFRIEDTEGKPLPEVIDEYVDHIDSLPLIEVAKNWGIDVSLYSGHNSGASGWCSTDPNKLAIGLGVENLSTWAHEMIHAADMRLGTIKKGRDNKWHREIVAELGSAILLTCIGMDHAADLGGAYDYICSYATREKRKVSSACIEVIDQTCKCVNAILDARKALQVSA